ncbi:MAG: polyphosphate polymerase domain-containing protein [Hungatella sp.]|nr:polyphosphate polymerase domain-containing protein [Hungatella sp.]
MKYSGHVLRHEIKYYINEKHYFNLCRRLKVITKQDSNAKKDGYLVSSVYFDDPCRSALEEKKAGAEFRKKYRLRCYNREDKLIRLECKKKYGDFIAKESAEISRREYDLLLKGEYDFLLEKDKTCRELYLAHHIRLLKPILSVEYFREAYIFEIGNVRITFDKNISFSVSDYDVFSEYYSVCQALEQGIMVMEVKFDELLPDVILQVISTVAADRCAISKYVMCSEAKEVYLR